MDLCLIITAGDIAIPELTDDNLFSFFKPTVLECILKSEIIHFGFAPDNTADNQDDLLLNEILFRIVCPDNFLSLEIESTDSEIRGSFYNLIDTKKPFWRSVIVEKGFINTETTIEFSYR